MNNLGAVAITRDDVLFIVGWLAGGKSDPVLLLLVDALEQRWTPAAPEILEQQPGDPRLFHRGGCMCPECGRQP